MVWKSYGRRGERKEAATAGEINAASAQYDKWIRSGDVTPNVAPAPNGIAFLPEYKNWKAISSTERFDNQTLRQILGNDVAVKTIPENHINPWPDRTQVPNGPWLPQRDEKALLRASAVFLSAF